LNPKTIEAEKSVLTLRRVIIEGVKPEVDGGRFPIKRIVGERVTVEADIFADGHSMLSAVVCYRPARARAWHESAMQLIENDRWRGQFRVETLEPFVYTFQAWVDEFQTWNRDFIKKFDAGQEISLDLLAGAKLIDAAASRASHADSQALRQFANNLKNGSGNGHSFPVERIRDAELAQLMQKYPDRSAATTYEKELRVVVSREKAGFSSWYEMFPRSCTSDPSKPGTFRDCISKLDYVAGMGFDVLYLPPIHPIGYTGRKGKKNTLQPFPGDPGSPWAIGSSEGGHKSIHPQLGTLDDLKLLMAAAKDRGIEIALDIAFQAAPDHPYVKEHDEWFRHRPDGSIQYAENPPKKYEDIFPLYFENEHAQELCEELKSVVTYWMDQGIRIFRVDNPHTKPFAFWEWLIGDVNRDHPDAIFLAEAFTRPKVMYRLAKIGFTQSYTYFAWKNTKFELTQYFTELTQTGVNEFFRPNLWPNTPDILNDYLQHGGRPAFMARLILAATLGANYGIYGPAFELCENQPLRPGSEEYLNSEKYEIRVWDIDRPDSLSPLIRRVNKIRREHAALLKDWSLRFLPVDNDQIIAYSKTPEDLSHTIVTIVNLDPHYTQSGWVQLPLREMGLPSNQPYEVEDLLTDARYSWQGDRNYVALDPSRMPAHILKIR
jgi:starch synthase (maltosyl-transferring)